MLSVTLKSRSASLSKPLISRGLLGLRNPCGLRLYSLQRPEGEYENEIFTKLEQSFAPKELIVQDVSGGCGSMFAIRIESSKFTGLTPVKQQKLVYEVLGDEIAKWHGVQLRTVAVKD